MEQPIRVWSLDVIYGDGILPCFRYLVMWPFPRLPVLPVAHLIPLPRRRYVVWLALGLGVLTDPGYLVDILTPVSGFEVCSKTADSIWMFCAYSLPTSLS